MTPRQFLRAVGWLVSEMIPAQAVDCARNRDYEQALVAAEADADALEPGELNHRFYCNRCGGGYYRAQHDCLRTTNPR